MTESSARSLSLSVPAVVSVGARLASPVLQRESAGEASLAPTQRLLRLLLNGSASHGPSRVFDTTAFGSYERFRPFAAWSLLIAACLLFGCAAPKPITARPDPDGGLQAHEAPMLARLVRAGKLPPLAQRLPSDPLAIKPLEQPGLYGGTWHMMVDAP